MPPIDEELAAEGRWIGDVWIDVIVESTYSLTASVTDHPVEVGTDITDHVHVEPEQLTITGIVTNTPIEVPLSHAAGATVDRKPMHIVGEPEYPAVLGIAQAAFGPFGLLRRFVEPTHREFPLESLRFSQQFDRVAAVDLALKELLKARVPVPVYTPSRVYEAVVLTSYEPQATQRGVLRFTVNGRVIRVVDSELGDVPKPKEKRSKPAVSKGKQQATPEEESTDSFTHKGLKPAIDKIGEFVKGIARGGQ